LKSEPLEIKISLARGTNPIIQTAVKANEEYSGLTEIWNKIIHS
jgi:hypothetical protein